MLGVTCHSMHFLYSCLPSLIRYATNFVSWFVVLNQNFQLGTYYSYLWWNWRYLQQFCYLRIHSHPRKPSHHSGLCFCLYCYMSGQIFGRSSGSEGLFQYVHHDYIFQNWFWLHDSGFLCISKTIFWFLGCTIHGMIDRSSWGPGKLPIFGVHEFDYLRPQNHQTSVHKFGYLRLALVNLCPKIWLFEGRFLPS